MDDNFIYFSIDGRNLKINKENPDDIFMLKTHSGKYKMKTPRWNQIKVQTNEKGYKLISISPKQYKLHRVNYFAHNQDWDIYNSCIKTNSVDHIDIDITNNNIVNLRVLTNQENCFNRNCKGYYWHKQTQKWCASIYVNYKRKHLGYFILEEDARQAYLEAKKIYHIID